MPMLCVNKSHQTGLMVFLFTLCYVFVMVVIIIVAVVVAVVVAHHQLYWT